MGIFGGPKNGRTRAPTRKCEQLGGFEVSLRVLETTHPFVRANLNNYTLIISKVPPIGMQGVRFLLPKWVLLSAMAHQCGIN